jgi:enamine deaminase RidA (YjgF/YER057c/UK114 family)
MTAEEKLRELGLTLPTPPPAVGAYLTWVRAGNLVFTSGQLPWKDGKLTHTGKLGAEVSVEQGYQAARQAALNGLAQLRAALGDLEKVRQLVRLDGFVHAAPGFVDHPKVLNGASDLLNEVLGPRGLHTRTALGINEMPLNAAVQLGFIALVAD